MNGKDLLSVADLSGDDIQGLVDSATRSKGEPATPALAGKTLALLFENPSLRTRVSFEVAIAQLGGRCIYLSPAEVGLGKRESVPDVARVLSRYVDVIAARASHEALRLLSRFATVPVINALSELEHPCQAMADLLTIYEKKARLGGLTLAYVGDGNNVANSLVLAASLAGMNVRIASPAGYLVQENIIQAATGYCRRNNAELICLDKPGLAVAGADVVYTDVWASMGQEAEASKRRQVFAAYQVNDELMSLAKKDAILMHPLPAHRGEEVSETILDEGQSVVFDQAENRMHFQKALLMRLLAR
ncbi:MAG: ornithine carbamoyltransferase [Chloroflexi bacterium]|nr:ornithine carbamoyltransferase [Chloroflexota bacterium]